jgi:hypothetical protein
MMATYTNRALVVLDAPMDVNVKTRSWYDCQATTPATVDEMVGAGTLPIVEEGQGLRQRVQRRNKGNKQIDRQNNNNKQHHIYARSHTNNPVFYVLLYIHIHSL